MAVQVNTVTVGTTATRLDVSGQTGSVITFTSPATTAVEVGGSGVTFGTGYGLKTNTEYTYNTSEGPLYAVIAASTVDIDVLTTAANQE